MNEVLVPHGMALQSVTCRLYDNKSQLGHLPTFSIIVNRPTATSTQLQRLCPRAIGGGVCVCVCVCVCVGVGVGVVCGVCGVCVVGLWCVCVCMVCVCVCGVWCVCVVCVWWGCGVCM